MTGGTNANTDAAADVVLIEADGPVRIVTLNRPDVLNAANSALHTRLTRIWTELEADDACRAVVLTGAGRAFCAGGDLDVLSRMHTDVAFRQQMLDEGIEIVQRMVRFPLPIVAAVNGPAVGLGCSLAGLSDLVLIEAGAYLADPHVSVGLVAGDGGAITWPSLMSLLRVKEYLFTGDRIPAEVAVEVGLANRVVADGTSVTEAVDLAQRLARQPRQALRDTKRAVNKHIERAVLDVLDFAISAEAVASASPEHAAIIESMRARSEQR